MDLERSSKQTALVLSAAQSGEAGEFDAVLLDETPVWPQLREAHLVVRGCHPGPRFPLSGLIFVLARFGQTPKLHSLRRGPPKVKHKCIVMVTPERVPTQVNGLGPILRVS